MSKKWEHNIEDRCWLIGEPLDGCGVFKERAGWYYNVAIGNNIYHDGPYEDRQDAMDDAEAEWARLKKIYV